MEKKNNHNLVNHTSRDLGLMGNGLVGGSYRQLRTQVSVACPRTLTTPSGSLKSNQGPKLGSPQTQLEAVILETAPSPSLPGWVPTCFLVQPWELGREVSHCCHAGLAGPSVSVVGQSPRKGGFRVGKGFES